jgi:mRNA interferase RelE/StbE
VYSIVVKPSAAKEFSALPKKDAAKVSDKIESLKETAFPIGAKKLKGKANIWRLRFGDYRIIYLPPDKSGKITILSIANRADAYKLI